MKTIKGKILASSLSMLLIAFITSLSIVIFNFNSLVSSFLNLSQSRANEVANDMREWSKSTKQKISGIYEDALKTKGTTLMVQDTLVIKPAFLDNALTDIKTFLTKKFELDDEIVQASFFTVENEEIKAWHFVNEEFPKGLGFMANYDMKGMNWVSRSENGAVRVVRDARIASIKNMNVSQLQIIDYKLINSDGTFRPIKAYEVIVPIVDGDLSDIESLRSDGESIGYLYYVLSLEKMQHAIENEEKEVSNALVLQQHKGAKADKSTREIGFKYLVNSIYIVAFSSVVIIILTFLLSLKIASRIAKPIGDLTKSAAVIASGNYDNPVVVIGSDEVGVLGKTFDKMREKVKLFTGSLQDLIDEKTDDISSMLSNIEQGIFTITRELKVHPEYSTYLEKIFETHDIAGLDFGEFLFKQTSLDTEQVSCAISTVMMSMGASKLIFHVNARHLPVEFSISRNGVRKYLELDWCPILKKNTVEKIMVTVRDVTELKKLQEMSQQKAQELSIIEQLMHIEIGKFGEIYERSRGMLKEALELLGGDTVNSEDLKRVFRNLHTVKGVLRTYGLKITTSMIHNIEEDFTSVKDSAAMDLDNLVQIKMRTSIIEAIESLDQYRVFNDEKLGRKAKTAIDEGSMNEVKKVIDLFFTDAVEAERLYNEVEIILNEPAKMRLKKGIADLVMQVSRTSAKSLGKKDLRFLFIGQDLEVRPDLWTVLDGVLTHIIRNALDHGIEGPEQRLKAGKLESGLVTAQVLVCQDKWIDLVISDDGRGLNIVELKSKSRLSEPASVTNVADSIFESSVSTASSVTEISGRGLGMEAVKSMVESLDGQISIDLGKVRNGFVAVSFRIRLPLQKVLPSSISSLAS